MIAGVLITLHGTTTFTGGITIAHAPPAAHKDCCAHLFNLSYPDITWESMETASKIKRMLPATDSPSMKQRFVSKIYLILKLQTLRYIDLKACNKKMHENLQIYRYLTKQELSSGNQNSISNLQPIPLQNRIQIIYTLLKYLCFCTCTPICYTMAFMRGSDKFKSICSPLGVLSITGKSSFNKNIHQLQADTDYMGPRTYWLAIKNTFIH